MENGTKTPTITPVDISQAKTYFDGMVQQLETQAKDIEDAAKVLQLQATNNAHDAHDNEVRSQQLDIREKAIVDAETKANDILQEARQIKSEAIKHRNHAQEQASINDMRKIELDKQEAMVDRKKKEVDEGLKRLGDRSKLLERNLRSM